MTTKKTIITSLSLIASGIVLWKVIPSIIAVGQDKKKLDEIEENRKKGTSISDDEAQTLADSLYNCMKGFGTSESSIVKIICESGYTSDDLAKIYNKFGYKEYGTFGEPIFGGGDKLDLIGWLHKELSGDNLMYVKRSFQQAGYDWDKIVAQQSL